MEFLINKQRVRVQATQAVGKGGEADVFRLTPGTALKVFKSSSHPDLQGFPDQQKAADERLALHQSKLPRFPRHLPARVIAPEALATDLSGTGIAGYTMKFLDDTRPLAAYADRTFRSALPALLQIAPLFLDLHQTLADLHHRGVIVGDFNDLNVLVKYPEGYFIDADSFQFGQFPCTVYTLRVLDPLLCEARAGVPVPVKPYNADADWYAFNVLLMECLLFVNPFGGIHRPKNGTKAIPHALRPLRRVTVFHPEVRYPNAALPFSVLPDELLHHFHQVFERDTRGEFPIALLRALRFSVCPACGFEHARPACPQCSQGTRPAASAPVTVRGKVTATVLFKTSGRIMFARLRGEKPTYLFHEQGGFKNETGREVLQGTPSAGLRLQALSDRVLVIISDSFVVLDHAQRITATHPVTVLDGIPQVATTVQKMFWIHGNKLYHHTVAHSSPIGQRSGQPSLGGGEIAPGLVGEVLANQTRFWVGPTFGFGFYRAGTMNVAFVFPTQGAGINDRVSPPVLNGTLIQANCVFTAEYCWFFALTRSQGQNEHSCTVIRADGQIIATITETDVTESHWLYRQTARAAYGKALLAATDTGVVRVEIGNGTLSETRHFPDAEPFVHDALELFVTAEGLIVVTEREIRLLQIAG